MKSKSSILFGGTLFLFGLFLWSCGGGSTTTNTTPGGNSETKDKSINGTVAVGMPITDATVMIKGKNGNSKSGITDSNGRFDIDASDIELPALIMAPTGTENLYSIANSSGTTNVHPDEPCSKELLRDKGQGY